MKPLLKIVGGSFAVFLALAMVEEREAFAPLFAWLSDDASAPAPAVLAEQDRRAAVDAVRELLSLWGHLEESGGDPRFVERLPASAEVVDEMLAEVAYLRHNYRRQEQNLIRLEVLSADASDPRHLSLLTREFWVVRTYSSVHPRQELGPVRSTVVHVRYLLEKDGARWRVVHWLHVPAPSEPEGASEPEEASGPEADR